MTIRSAILLSFALIMATLPLSSFAQEQATEKNDTAVLQQEPQKQKAAFPANPHIDDLSAHAKKLVEGLDKEALRTLYEIRNSFGITRSVHIVHQDVKKAVHLCGEKNPALKEDITKRFNTWDNAIMPAVKAAEQNRESVIDTQTVRPAEDVREYLRLTKEAADFTENQIEKNPVTTEDACQALIKSMDNTQNVIKELIEGIELSALNEKAPE